MKKEGVVDDDRENDNDEEEEDEFDVVDEGGGE